MESQEQEPRKGQHDEGGPYSPPSAHGNAPHWKLHVALYIDDRADAKADLRKYDVIDQCFQISGDPMLDMSIHLTPNHRLNFFDTSRVMQRREALEKAVSPHTRATYGPEQNTAFNANEVVFQLVATDVCRSFLVEVCEQLEKDKLKIETDELEALNHICLNSIRDHHEALGSAETQSVHEYRNVVRAYLTINILQMPILPSTNWKLVACLLRARPSVDEDATFPATFSVEEVGRDGWIVTTYGDTPLRHVMRPDVCVRLPKQTYLQYDVQVQHVGHARKMRMMDLP